MSENDYHHRTLLYALCLAMEVVNNHRRRAPSHYKSGGSGRWFVDVKRINPGTVTHLF